MDDFKKLFDFSGKRALVTGAASGIGRAIARALTAQGANVVLADRDADALRTVTSAFPSSSESYVYDQGDLLSIESLAAAAGDVEILVNNAGVVLRGPLLELEWADLRRVVDVNLVGPIALTRLVGQGMVRRRIGTIINIGSQMAFNGARHRAVYSSTKAAISQFTKSAALEWGAFGVRVNCIAPGRTLTPLNDNVLTDPIDYETGLQRIPLQRYGQPDDIANVALFLASGAAAYVTGHTIVADGGWILE
ncbi:SDR family NAD(P)-dependent oxidoreductase [Paraburkholderia fungorum]|uniref:SDR family NAD(P)-dependent oxidoreductase n=1 Tax=Paraburkholderia fungorum TaxID=134537 RepID=UPI0038BC2DEE